MNDLFIYRYTRADAIDDGALIDVSASFAPCGIRWPVAVTPSLHAEIARIAGSEERLTDAFTSAAITMLHTIKSKRERSLEPGDIFTLVLQYAGQRLQIKVAFSVDELEDGQLGPCWTLMLPEED